MRPVPPPGSADARIERVEREMLSVRRDFDDWKTAVNIVLRAELESDRSAFLAAMKSMHIENLGKLELLMASQAKVLVEQQRSSAERESRKLDADPDVRRAEREANRKHTLAMLAIVTPIVLGVGGLVVSASVSWCGRPGSTPVPAYAAPYAPPATLTPYVPPH